jgi:FkbM family methyltransferase
MSSRGPYKTQTLQILRERGIPVGTILDVGVCHGTPELMAAWPDRHHLLFEPVAEFEQNILRAYRNIRHELHQVAVGDRTGTIGLTTEAVLPGMAVSHSHMTDTDPGADPSVRSVRKIALDDFLPGRGLAEPYLLKIDIDGQELQVLKGAAETLKRCSIVIVECPRGELVQRIGAVQAAGFTLFDLCEPCYYDKTFWQCDAVFLRNDLHRQHFRQLAGKVEPGMYETFR